MIISAASTSRFSESTRLRTHKKKNEIEEIVKRCENVNVKGSILDIYLLCCCSRI